MVNKQYWEDTYSACFVPKCSCHNQMPRGINVKDTVVTVVFPEGKYLSCTALCSLMGP